MCGVSMIEHSKPTSTGMKILLFFIGRYLALFFHRKTPTYCILQHINNCQRCRGLLLPNQIMCHIPEPRQATL